MALGKRNRIRQVGPAERLDEQEPQCRCLSFDGARRELPIAEQMNLVLANVVQPPDPATGENTWRTPSTAWT